MPKRIIERICDAIRNENYDMTHHSVEEMAEDFLTVNDIEHAILNGEINTTIKDDPRGNRFIINGVGKDKVIPIGIVGRFKETGVFLIITVYKITEEE